MPVVEYHLRPRKKRKNFSLTKETEKAVRMLITTLTTMIAVLAVMLLLISNATAQKGYTLEQQKLRNQSLKTANNSIEARLTDAAAATDVGQNPQVKDMAEVTDKTYVSKEDNTPN